MLYGNNKRLRFELTFIGVEPSSFPLTEEDVDLILNEIKLDLLSHVNRNGGYRETDGPSKIHRHVGYVNLDSFNNSMNNSLDNAGGYENE